MAKKEVGWLNPPPVIVVSGSEGFYTRRQLQKAILAAGHTGRSVEFVDGKEPGALDDILDGGMFMSDPVLAVVHNPDKLDPEVVAEHHASKNTDITLLLYYEGDFSKTSDMGKVAACLPARLIRRHPKPDWFKQKDVSAQFVIKELKNRGKTISERLADALVNRVGEDLGVLYFEVLKLSTYLDALGEEAAKPEHVQRTMVRTGEAKIGPIVEALGKQSVPALLRAMDQFQVNQGGDPDGRTLAVCAWAGGQVMHWLHAASLHSMGASTGEACSRMGMKPYRYETFVLPIAERWGVSRLVGLVKNISRVERAAKSSCIDSWVLLETALVTACRVERARG